MYICHIISSQYQKPNAGYKNYLQMIIKSIRVILADPSIDILVMHNYDDKILRHVQCLIKTYKL